jgi:predicted amidohydrolase
MMDYNQKLPVALLQLPSSKRYQNNLDRLVNFIKQNPKTKIIVAPEVYITAYDYEHLSTAAKFSAKAIKELKKLIDEQILVLTVILKDKKSGDFVNRAIVIHKHKIVHKQDKYKLFRLGDEHKYLKAGKAKKIKPFEIDGIKFGLLICFELRFKELWKQLEGADIVIIPARWGLPRKLHLDILSRALAVMNQCFVLLCNSSDSDMASSSSIISPTGEYIQDDSKEIIKYNINLKDIKKMRRYIVMD